MLAISSLAKNDHTRFEVMMFTMTFDSEAKLPLYEQLARRIRGDIESGDLKRNERLPSKRKLAKHLHISIFTVQNSYTQLLEEGYISSAEKKGYYVCAETLGGTGRKTPSAPWKHSPPVLAARKTPSPVYDLKTNAVDTEHFPYSVWSRLMREAMRENPVRLLGSGHPQGDEELRAEIARYLKSFRDVNIRPEQIILGAGFEYLVGLITELLPAATFACENPGYQKIRRILESRRVSTVSALVDQGGLAVEHLAGTKATAVFVTPSNHFPTGAVMGIARRHQLIEWARQKKERYIIEDDFDSEFRYALKPIPALQSLGASEKVIYINSFGQTLSPSLRIAYVVLPQRLLSKYLTSLMFYSCTVSQFEQLTLMRFLRDGYYERHLARMRTVYKNRQNAFVESLSPAKNELIIDGQKAGLSLCIKSPKLSEKKMTRSALKQGVRVYPFSGYYSSAPPETHTIVLGYAGYSPEELRLAAGLLRRAWGL